jgi:hypothetical protein
VPVYPSAALATALVAWAYETHRLPSEVYADYLEHPRDYLLLFEYGHFSNERAEAERKKAEKQPRGH